jgi:hypothetical protein
MKNSNRPELGIDDERFDDLFDNIELLLSAFFTEIATEELSKDDKSLTDDAKEDIAAECEVAMGYLAVILAALDVEIISTSKNQEGQLSYDIKLTVPSGDLNEVMRQVIQNLDSDEFD